MRRASIAALKARLSEYLDAVRSGEEIIVTDRSKPVARLVPIAEADRLGARMAELIRTGRARPAQAKLPKDFWKRPRPEDPGDTVLQALLEERAESR